MDVPADIQEKAKAVWADAVEQSRAEGAVIDVSALIAQALLSERLAQKERDADVASGCWTTDAHWDCCGIIAAAIRKS
jgi:hypothetical protein